MQSCDSADLVEIRFFGALLEFSRVTIVLEHLQLFAASLLNCCPLCLVVCATAARAPVPKMATSSAGSTIASLRRANDLLGQLRQSIRQVEVVPVVSKMTPGSGGGDADNAQRQKVDQSENVFWTASTIQVWW